MNRHKLVITTSLLVFLMFPAIFSSAADQTVSTEDIGITDLYSSIDSADVTLHSGAHYTDITIDAELMLEGEVLRTERFEINEAIPDTDITKVVAWDLKSLEDGFYITRMTLSMGSSVLDTTYHNFSYGSPTLPRVFIKDIIPDSRGVSVIISPYRTVYGTQAVLTDVEYMLVDGDTVIYRTTDQRVDVVQTTPLSVDWNVRLLNNHPYSARVKINVPSQRQRDTVIARSVDFTAKDDVRITELYRDETGASATVLGLSQVPFTGEIVFAVSKDGETIEEIREQSPILMSDDDETTEVIWDSRLPKGTYELSVKVIGNDGDVVDILETVIEAEESGYNASATATTAPETPGFNVCQVVFAVMALYLFRRNG